MAEETKRVYESVVMAMPELKMVLVHARNNAQNANRAPIKPVEPEPVEDSPADQRLAVRRIIEHLKESE